MQIAQGFRRGLTPAGVPDALEIFRKYSWRNHTTSAKAGDQEAGVLLVLAEGVAELLRQHLLFLPGFDAIANQRQDNAQHASPFADDQSRSPRVQNQSGVDGLP